jgi:hypothetical protein
LTGRDGRKFKVCVLGEDAKTLIHHGPAKSHVKSLEPRIAHKLPPIGELVEIGNSLISNSANPPNLRECLGNSSESGGVLLSRGDASIQSIQ